MDNAYNACNGSIRVANNIITKSLIIGKSKQSQIIDSDLIIEAVNELTLGWAYERNSRNDI